MWFERLVGFKENASDDVRSKLEIDGNFLKSKVNGQKFILGELEVISLENLRNRTKLDIYTDRISVEEIVGNVQTLHQLSENNGAIFQAASQFNLLEMLGPDVSPESGVGIYENDYTQGPACAIACGAGTIYRNYFTEVNGRMGQSKDNQIDCLDDVGIELGNSKFSLWKMKNGYALPTSEGLQLVTEIISSKSQKEYDYLKSKLKVGIQWNTQVTLCDSKNLVTQIYCSALPVSYSSIPSSKWEIFARLILESTYESTLHTALINYENTGNRNVYLTLVGGGAFGNEYSWIFDSIKSAINKFKYTPLNIKIVSFGGSKQIVRDFVSAFK